MAKLKPEKITQNDLIEYSDGHSDFGFELKVLKMLREHDVNCDHGGHYADPVTNKSREFDIRATKTIGTYRVRMAVECKNIRENFPILVSCVPRHEKESYHQVANVCEPSPYKVDKEISNVVWQSGGDQMPFDQSRATVFKICEPHSLYAAEGLVGKSTVQVGRGVDSSFISNDSELYEKWGQCLSSLHGMTQALYWDGDTGDSSNSFMSSVFPFVVVPDGRLWMVSYDLDGKKTSDPKEVSRCSCFIGKDYKMGTERASACLWVSHLEIVTLNGLREFVESYLMTEEGMQKVFPSYGCDVVRHKFG